MPSIQELHETLGDRDDVLILAINNGDSRDVVAAYWEESGFTFDAVIESDAAEKMGVRAFPTNLVVDADGKVVFRAVGFGEQIEHAIHEHLGVE